MTPNQSIFRAYDIRGIYPRDLNEKTAYQIGRAFSIYLKNKTETPENMAVGHDARLSSPALFRSFVSGAVDGGINVWNIGFATVDMIYFSSGHFHVPAAMITASHNPKDWNGFKLVKSGAESFPVSELENIINSGAPKSRDFRKGEEIHKDVRGDYLRHILSFITAENIRPMRVAIDGSNGAVGPVLESALAKLPIDCAAINFNPDGDFPSHDPDPTKEKNLSELISKIKSGHYHFGCAFDGDGDRVIFVDENGDPVSSSIIAALMSRYFLSKENGGRVVYDATMSRIVPEVVRMYNGEATREKVGQTFISRRLKEIDGVFGAEKSGHYFFRNNFYADSGIIGFLIMLQVLSGQKKSLSVLVKEFSKYVSTPEINFKIKEPPARNASPARIATQSVAGGHSEAGGENLIKKIAQNFEGYEVDWLDGLTVSASDFWLNLRPSNTEPLARLNIEAKDELTLNQVKKDLTSLIKNYAEVDIL